LDQKHGGRQDDQDVDEFLAVIDFVRIQVDLVGGKDPLQEVYDLAPAVREIPCCRPLVADLYEIENPFSVSLFA
jgi:hypothetical protein